MCIYLYLWYNTFFYVDILLFYKIVVPPKNIGVTLINKKAHFTLLNFLLRLERCRCSPMTLLIFMCIL